MNVVDAFWEKRNLGIKSCEIMLSKDDTMADFLRQEKILIENNTKYIVVKTDVASRDFLFELPKYGYIFIETSFLLSLKKSNYICPQHVARFDRAIEVKIADSPGDRQRVFDEVRKGIFNTDRIAIDKFFTQDLANIRYINWMMDLVDQGNAIYEVFLNDKPIGFFQFKKTDEEKVQGILTGVYERYLASGIGTLVMKKLYDTIWSSGNKIYYATVVTNNIKALRSNMMFGSEVDNVSYNYIKHIE